MCQVHGLRNQTTATHLKTNPEVVEERVFKHLMHLLPTPNQVLHSNAPSWEAKAKMLVEEAF